MIRVPHLARAVIAATVTVAVVITAVRSWPSRPAPLAVTSGLNAAEPPPTGGVDSIPEIDRTALAELARMGGYLRTLKAFQLKADVVTEVVRRDGQKVQIMREVDLVAKRPNRLYAEVTNDRQRRLFFYDGSTFTLFAPRLNYYATAPAPATIEKLADQLEEKFGLVLPLVDLFRWGTPAVNAASIKSAIDLGPSQVAGVTCEQYAFHQDGLDWQVWIQLGEQPLPRRLVITTLSDEARPQHIVTYRWNLAPSFNDGTFVFEKPGNAKKISFAQVAVTPTIPKSAQR
jgi:hypothetical protein